jgi:hypothetical protein
MKRFLIAVLLGLPLPANTPLSVTVDPPEICLPNRRLETMTRDEVLAICKQVAPKYGYDPLMILAQVEQESAYNPFIPRLEQGYLQRYILTDDSLSNLSPAVQVQLASSFGLGQLLGHSLQQLGYFFALDSVTVAMALDRYIATPRDQVETQCQWLKRKQQGGTLDDALRRYNGSSSYPPLIYARYERLKKVYG